MEQPKASHRVVEPDQWVYEAHVTRFKEVQKLCCTFLYCKVANPLLILLFSGHGGDGLNAGLDDLSRLFWNLNDTMIVFSLFKT